MVYALAVELYKSTDGGANWSQVSNANVEPYKIHADQHGFDFIPGNPNGFYLGNDGGMYKSLDGAASFINLNTLILPVDGTCGPRHKSVNLPSAYSETSSPCGIEEMISAL